jgi:hypothetical protein
MPWGTYLKSTESGKMVLVPPSEKPDSNDPRYEQEVHIVPVKVDGENISLGIHDLVRECVCHPKIQEQVHERTLIIHREMVN